MRIIAEKKSLVMVWALLLGVVAAALVAQRDVEVAVGAEVQIAALVVAVVVELLDQHLLGAASARFGLLVLTLKRDSALVPARR